MDAHLDAALTGARAGDPDAFAVLYRGMQPLLLRYLWLLAGPDAEDVAAETWASVVRDLSAFEGDAGAFRAWLWAVARHRWADEQRRRMRRPVTPVEDLPEDPGAAPDPADLAVVAESTRRALVMIAALPPAQAEAVFLRAVAGLPVADVASIMNRSPGAIRVLAHRGLRTLAERLGPGGDGP
ncbi:MAG: sigma-70 family RNA polymerase sigma factor [Candidatus Nanopelagicales bacterium]